MTDRDELLKEFVLTLLAVERSTSIPFWQAFGAGGEAPDHAAYREAEKRVWAVQAGLRSELKRLASELWPEHGS